MVYLFLAKNRSNFVSLTWKRGNSHYHIKQCLDKKSKSGEEDVKVIDSEEVTECYQTRFEDSITSMSVRDDTIVLGDVNAEIHVLNRKPDVPLSKGM